MRLSRLKSLSRITLSCVCVVTFLATPVRAQDTFDSHPNPEHGKQTLAPPMLQGAYKGGDASVIQDINTPGVFRSNSGANVVALLNILMQGVQIIGVVAGLACIMEGSIRLRMGDKAKLKNSGRLMVAGTSAALISLLGSIAVLLSKICDYSEPICLTILALGLGGFAVGVICLVNGVKSSKGHVILGLGFLMGALFLPVLAIWNMGCDRNSLKNMFSWCVEDCAPRNG